jgi:MFS family permease
LSLKYAELAGSVVLPPPEATRQSAGGWRAWTSLAILIAFYMLSLLDRQILSLLVLPIQADLGLNDGQLGLLQGLAFIVLYSIFGLVFGWGVDFASRRWILFGSVVVWSLSTIACGLALTFKQLLLARMMVGLGEASLAPASLALMGALFARDRLSLANGIYFMGTNIGSAIFFTVGGRLIGHFVAQGGAALPLLGHVKAWQASFIIFGTCGLPLALLAFGLHDVRHKRLVSGPEAGQEGLLAFFRRRGRLFLGHVLGYSCLTSGAYALISWSPAFFGRVHHFSPAQVGAVIGVSYGICGACGNLMWGAIISRLMQRGRRDAAYRIFSLLPLLGVPVAILGLTTSNTALSVVCICLTWPIMLAAGPLNTALQLFTPAHLRGRTGSIMMLSVGLFSVGLTPWLIGLLTEHVLHDRQKVGISMAIFITVCGLLGALILGLSRKGLERALREDDAKEGLLF